MSFRSCLHKLLQNFVKNRFRMLRGLPQRGELGALEDLIVLPRVEMLSSWQLHYREYSFCRVFRYRIVAAELLEDRGVPLRSCPKSCNHVFKCVQKPLHVSLGELPTLEYVLKNAKKTLPRSEM